MEKEDITLTQSSLDQKVMQLEAEKMELNKMLDESHDALARGKKMDMLNEHEILVLQAAVDSSEKLILSLTEEKDGERDQILQEKQTMIFTMEDEMQRLKIQLAQNEKQIYILQVR